MIFQGVFFGLLAAASQAAAYVFSRHLLSTGGESKRLLVCSQILLGAISLPAVIFTGWWRLMNWKLLGVIIFSGAFFMFAQFFFFEALKRIESSKIASLVGLKTLVIALLMFLLFGKKFNICQLIALAMTAGAAVLMNYQRQNKAGKNRGGGWSGMGYLTLALFGYSFSDLGAYLTVELIPGGNTVERGLAGTAFNNIYLLLLCLPFAVKWKISLRETARSAAYSLSWGAGILFLYVCFGFIGAAFGTVVQAMRGPISFFLGIILASRGFSHLEQKLSIGGWIQRGAAALLMFAAIVLYALSD